MSVTQEDLQKLGILESFRDPAEQVGRNSSFTSSSFHHSSSCVLCRTQLGEAAACNPAQPSHSPCHGMLHCPSCRGKAGCSAGGTKPPRGSTEPMVSPWQATYPTHFHPPTKSCATWQQPPASGGFLEPYFTSPQLQRMSRMDITTPKFKKILLCSMQDCKHPLLLHGLQKQRHHISHHYWYQHTDVCVWRTFPSIQIL